MIYYAFVHLHLICGIEMYGNAYMKHLKRLMILNNITKCTSRYPFYHSVLLFILFHSDLHSLEILKFVHNFVHYQEKLPCIFSTCFTKNNVSPKQ